MHSALANEKTVLRLLTNERRVLPGLLLQGVEGVPHGLQALDELLGVGRHLLKSIDQ